MLSCEDDVFDRTKLYVVHPFYIMDHLFLSLTCPKRRATNPSTQQQIN